MQYLNLFHRECFLNHLLQYMFPPIHFGETPEKIHLLKLFGVSCLGT